MRIIRYTGIGRIETIKEQVGGKGYAAGFEGLIDYVMALLPANEVIVKALRNFVFSPIFARRMVYLIWTDKVSILSKFRHFCLDQANQGL